MSGQSPHIALIGAGNVGYHLGQRLHEKGQSIVQVYSRKQEKAQRLASILQVDFTTDLSAIDRSAAIYILAIKDDAIATVAQQLSERIAPDALVVHTSGATPSTVLKPFFKNYGVFYPLQSFSIQRSANFETLPLCIHAPRKALRQKLESLARSICPNVYTIDDKQRAALHVAAVFANNFTNHLYEIAQQITQQEDVPFELLQPLILETALKVQEQAPASMQTGPAIRKDLQTLNRHLDYLSNNPQWAAVYHLLTKSIFPKFGDIE